MKYKVDVVRIRENTIQLNGWAIGNRPESPVEFAVEDKNHRPVEFPYVSTRRDDGSQIYFGKTRDKGSGFVIRFAYDGGEDY